MGEAEINHGNRTITIYSHIICYGNAATEELSSRIQNEIETMWNEPQGIIELNRQTYSVQFRISSQINKDIEAIEIYQNVDPRNNYFRIEEYVHGNISFVDDINCNTGYFKLENLYAGSTTAAHEYGHTLGLDHPYNLDIRGKGVPSIMYPRGTLVDASFQYDPAKPAGVTGGTMHPMFRKVHQKDIIQLNLHRLKFKNNKAIAGEFTNIYHQNHSETGHEDFDLPIVSG